MAPRQAVIVAGVRTPFARAGSVFKDTSAVALARFATRELLYRSGIEGRDVDEVIFGQVVQGVAAPNVAREVSLLPQFPRTIPAYSLNRGAQIGSLEPGKLANFAIFDCEDYRELAYWFGVSQTSAVYVRGECVYSATCARPSL